MTAASIQVGRTYAVKRERILTVLGKTRYLHLAGPWGGRAGYRPMISYDDPERDQVVVMAPNARNPMVIPYYQYRVGSGGASINLCPSAEVPKRYVAEAKACLRRNRDVVSIKVVRP